MKVKVVMKSGKNLVEASNQWANRPKDQRYETLAALRESVHGRRLRSRSVDLAMDSVSAKVENGEIVINSAITPCRPTHWSFGQLAWCSGAPASYIRELPAPLAVQCINHGLKNRGTRDENKFMTVTDPNGGLNTLQAITSTSYGRIWDAEVIDAVQRVNEKSGMKFFNPKDWTGKPSGLYASDHDVFVFMIDGGSIVDGPRAEINRGFIVSNSETCARSFSLMTFLFNKVCGNHIIWDATDVNRLSFKHFANAPTRFDQEVFPMLKAYSESSAKPVADAVKRAQKYLLPETLDEIYAWTGKNGKFNKAEINEAVAFAKKEEGDCRTLWQYVQGFTAYARGFDYIDARVDLEKRAGDLLNIVKD